MTDIMTDVTRSLIEDQPDKSQRMNRAMGNNINQLQSKHWWINLRYPLTWVSYVPYSFTYLCPYDTS